MEKYGFVYIWRDRKHARYYIGSHWGTEDDGYVCSSFWMKQAYKNRPDDFRRKILFRTDDRVLLRQKEECWLQLINPELLKERYYNLSIGATGHWSSYPENINTIREKIAHTTKQAMWRDDVRTNYIKGMKTRDNKSADPEVRRKRSISMMGKNVGKKRTEESKRKMSKAKMGTKHTEEHIRKQMVGISKLYGCPSCNKKMNAGNLTKHIRICKG